MNQTDIQRLAAQLAMYRTEAAAKRRNLAYLTHDDPSQTIAPAHALNDATMMIIRTEAKAVAIEELAQALGVAAEVVAVEGK